MSDTTNKHVTISSELNKAARKDPISTSLFHEIEKFTHEEFSINEAYFGIIYGSYAKECQKKTSDIDVMFVAEDVDKVRMNRCIDFIIGLHEKYGLPSDTEIRYEHKILIPLDFISRSVSGIGFKDENGSYHIPKIEKTRECLDSEALRHRFLHGMMAHQHLFVGGDRGLYETLRAKGIRELVKAITIAKGERIVSAQKIVGFAYKKMEKIKEIFT